MSISKVVRSLSLVALPLLADAWQSTDALAPCQTAGQVSGWDPLGHTVTLKSDSGHYSDFHYDGSTTFTNGEAIFRPDDLGLLEGLNIDDRLCVETFRGEGPAVASRIRVTSRTETDARDKQDLIRWQAASLSGTVTSLNPTNHRITVKASG